MAKIDLSTPPPSGGWTPAPEGMYAFWITEAEEKQSKAGNWMFQITLKGVNGEMHDKDIRDWIMLSGKAAHWHKRKLEAILARDITDGEEIKESDLVGRKVWGWMMHDEYTNSEGKKRISYKIDSSAGGDSCGYVSAGTFPWPDPGQQKPKAGPQEDLSIPFMFFIGTSLLCMMA